MPVLPTTDRLVDELADAWEHGRLPGEALDDWRIHPATLAWLVRRIAPPGLVLDVGAGRSLVLSRALAPWASVVAFDVKRATGRDGIACAQADVRALPVATGRVHVVVSRMFLGAPISQAARRVAARGSAHLVAANTIEHAVWTELARVSAPGACHVHHVLERVLHADPGGAGLAVLKAMDARVAGPPRPWRSDPHRAFAFHLSGVLVLRRGFTPVAAFSASRTTASRARPSTET